MQLALPVFGLSFYFADLFQVNADMDCYSKPRLSVMARQYQCSEHTPHVELNVVRTLPTATYLLCLTIDPC